MWLVAGLGNPGPAYLGTRHNVGFRVIEWAVGSWRVRFGAPADGVRVAIVHRGDEPVHLLQPLTHMNASGEPIARHLQQLGLAPGRLVVVHDDLDLPAGQLRVCLGGGAGGHRGVASIIGSLATQDFLRVRVGIGRPPPGSSVSDFVLSTPDADARRTLMAAEERAAWAIDTILTRGPAMAMNDVNQKGGQCGGPPL